MARTKKEGRVVTFSPDVEEEVQQNGQAHESDEEFNDEDDLGDLHNPAKLTQPVKTVKAGLYDT